MKRILMLALLVATTIASRVHAADAFIVRFNAAGRQSGNISVQWLDDVLFFNTTETPASVRLLGVSNGALQTDLPELVIPPGRTVSVNSAQVVNVRWLPTPVPPLWVMHVDVPTGVVIESRNEFYVSTGIPELIPISRGKVSMPIFAELTPSGKPQIHLGTDLGFAASRVNVGVYNASNDSASAVIEVRRTCDDVVMDTRVIAIPPNTVVQATGLTTGVSSTCTSRVTPAWMRYTVVRVTQPSVSFVSNLNEDLLPASYETGLIPVVGLAVAKNAAY
jgi:hypothetical protein